MGELSKKIFKELLTSETCPCFLLRVLFHSFSFKFRFIKRLVPMFDSCVHIKIDVSLDPGHKNVTLKLHF
jgi:hypothetical protein